MIQELPSIYQEAVSANLLSLFSVVSFFCVLELWSFGFSSTSSVLFAR